MKYTKIEWPTLALILVVYGAWAAAGIWIWPMWPAAALILMIVAAALHSSLTHEVLHGHPTRWPLFNEALVTLNIAIIWPYRRFKTLHLRHHRDERLTDPFEDPESYYLAKWSWEQMPAPMRGLLWVNNTMVGRVILGPLLATVALILADVAEIRAGSRKVALAWAIHLLASAAVLTVVSGAFGIPVWLYLLTVVWGAAAVISVRTYAEHQWSETPEGRTILVESPLFGFLFLHNNLHLVHHKNPGVAWYKLPVLYHSQRDRWHRLNKGYVYAGYWQLFRAHALRAKEPVCHPEWHKAPVEKV